MSLDNGNRPGLGAHRAHQVSVSDRHNQLAGQMNSARRHPNNPPGSRSHFRDWQVWNNRSYRRHNNWHRGYWGFSLFSPGFGFGYGGLGGFGLGYGGFGYGLGGYGLGGYGLGGYGYGMGGYGLGGYGYGGWGSPYASAFGWSPWGANYLGYSSGYYNYSNPYCSGPTAFYGGSTYDYTQPMIVAQDANQPVEQLPDNDPSVVAFNQARDEFKNGNYDRALQLTEDALGKTPKDSVLHEFRALTLFALGRYEEAAAPLYSVLAVGPGWDWATMAGLYGSVDSYAQQLRTLEQYHRDNPDSAAASFVLAYQYLTCGHLEAAASQLDNVIRINPQDLVAKRLLQALPVKDSEAGIPADQNQPEPTQSLTVPDLPATVPSLDAKAFSGTWTAANTAGTSFNVTFNDDGTFNWSADQNGQQKAMKGVFAIDGETLAMEPEAGGVMLGKVTNPAEGGFHFEMLGALEGDPGLDFKKAM